MYRLLTKTISNDICVSASTGSGKTLAYCVPIIEALLHRVIPRLRAIVILPTRDLAIQVKKTFDELLVGSCLKAGIAVGATSFSNEQASLVQDNDCDSFDFKTSMGPKKNDANYGETSIEPKKNDANSRMGQFSSKVDILICTPGRLLDHINSTPGFSLSHVKYLVMDEADRLMSQHYQGWVDIVYKHLEPSLPVQVPISLSSSTIPNLHSRVQKLLFSATLTRDPAQIAMLKLYDPVSIVVSNNTQKAQHENQIDLQKFTLPLQLSEKYIVAQRSEKPLVLLHLLHNVANSMDSVLVFVKSVESATRLAELLKMCTDSSTFFVASISSDLAPSTRKSILDSFLQHHTPRGVDKQGNEMDIDNGTDRRPKRRSVLVCSDLIARGIDLGASVNSIVNYDVPSNIVTYVHRVGRTARAGRSGTCYSLIEPSQLKWFRSSIANPKNTSIDRGESVEKCLLEKEEIQEYAQKVACGLSKIKDIFMGHASKGKRKRSDSVSSSSSSSSSSDDSDDSDDSDETDDSNKEDQVENVKETIKVPHTEQWDSKGWKLKIQ